jgi:hypothetical protein
MVSSDPTPANYKAAPVASSEIAAGIGNSRFDRKYLGFWRSSVANLFKNIVLNQMLADTFPMAWVIGNSSALIGNCFRRTGDLF